VVVQVAPGIEVEAHGGSATVSAAGQAEASGGTIVVRAAEPAAPPGPHSPALAVILPALHPDTSVEQRDLADGYESDEERRIFNMGEIQSSDDEDGSGDESDEQAEAAAEEQHLARRRARRGCLAGCDCERKRGRRCQCELRSEDGVCDERCGCDKSKCRTVAAEEDEEEADDEAAGGDS
jgi:hypothetical protein